MKNEQPNLSMIQEISSDQDFQKSILQTIRKEFLEEVKLFEDNFTSQQYENAAIHVHKIKHKVALLGLKQGEQLTDEFEKQLKKGKTQLHKQFLEVLQKIHVYLYH